MSFWSVGGSGRDYDDDNNKITIINLLYQFYIVQQITKNLVPQNNTNLICYGSVGQKSDKALPGLKFPEGFLSGSFGGIPFSAYSDYWQNSAPFSSLLAIS